MQAICSLKDILPDVLSRLQSPEAQRRNLLVDQWISIAGARVAAHTKPMLNRGQLTVWTDQSSLAFELNQKYRHSLLKRAQAVLGEEEIKTIRICVGQLR